MNSRLQQFLSAENLSQAQFADIIGVARASVSHIIAGRNKPGFDFIEGMLTNFPNLNIEWLITGRGKMYKTSPGLFPAAEEVEPAPEPTPPQVTSPSPAEESARNETIPSVELPKYTEGQRTVSKIIILFSDNSFQELK